MTTADAAVVAAPAILSCEQLDGQCCEDCHDDALDDAGDLFELEQGGVVVARVCCLKDTAARERLGLPAPSTTATNFR